MFSTQFDMQYGVRRMDDRLLINVENAETPVPPFGGYMHTFMGIPIYSNETLVSDVEHVKKWKRLNRPAKTRIRYSKVYNGYIVKPPISKQECIMCHPMFMNYLEAAIARKSK